MQITENDTIEALAQKSLSQYEKMSDLLRSMQQHLETHSSAYIQQFNDTYSKLQKEAQQVDHELMEQLSLNGIPDALSPCLEQRKSLQLDVMELLRATVSRANNVKSLLASEMQSLNKGRQALSGYNHYTDPQGRIVNRTL